MSSNVPLVYLAAPLFNEQERMFNSWLTGKLEPTLKVFLPQRDGALLVDMLASGVSQCIAERRIFEQDCAAMRRATLLIAVLDGGYIDEGVAFEIGFLHSLGTPAIGLQTDVRRALPTGNNPMIEKGLAQIFANVDDLLAWTYAFAECSTVPQSA